jgi:hypothetical protein
MVIGPTCPDAVVIHLRDTPGTRSVHGARGWTSAQCLPFADLAVMCTWRLWHLAFPAITLP